MARTIKCYNNILCKILQGVNLGKFGELQDIHEISSYKGQYVASYVAKLFFKTEQNIIINHNNNFYRPDSS